MIEEDTELGIPLKGTVHLEHKEDAHRTYVLFNYRAFPDSTYPEVFVAQMGCSEVEEALLICEDFKRFAEEERMITLYGVKKRDVEHGSDVAGRFIVTWYKPKAE